MLKLLRQTTIPATLAVCLVGVFWLSTGADLRGSNVPRQIEKQKATTKPASVDFEKQIAPLLARRCLECHSGSEPQGGLDLSRRESIIKGGESGTALVPGKFKKSLLWERIDAGEMPPKERLTESEQKLIERWIAGGAKWGRGAIDLFRYTTDKRAGYDWWSLQPVIRPKIPATKNQSWTRNPIDSFVLAKLEKQGLTPSAEASRRVLVRRLSFDLLGLPPDEATVQSFLKDDSPNAYEKLVQKFLASPHYGERWARHWLDIVHFGESQGFERDKLRENSWRYRDWVVNAFNADMPYDQFARTQLAGDVLRPNDPASVIATGFLVSGPYDEVGQNQQSAAMRAVVRQDELEDIASLVGQTYLGLTVNCARCHDHKFDPVRQKEYYQLTAALAGVRHGERNVGNLAMRNKSAERAESIRARITAIAQQQSELVQGIRRRILSKRKAKPRLPVTPPTPIAAWNFQKSLRDAKGSLDIRLNGNAKRDASGLHLDGKTGFASSTRLKRDLKVKTLEAWVRLETLEQRGGGVFGVQTLNGVTFDSIVYGEREPGQWMAGSNGFVRTQSFHGPVEKAATRNAVHIAIVYEPDGTIRGYRNGLPYGRAYKSSGPVTFQAGQSQVIFGLRHAPVGGNRMLAGTVLKANLYGRALNAREIAASAGVSGEIVLNEELQAAMTDAERERQQQLQFEIDRLSEQANRMSRTITYAVVPRQPAVTHFLIRGNPARKGSVVKPAGVKALVGVNADFQLKPNAPEAERRIQLAKWITDKRNPLFARVMVNRLWHFHFGAGILTTPSDFGFNGGRPSHPKLLDWLAAEFIDSGFSIKHLQQLIVTSATYRQSSLRRIEPAKVDADNRLLWRKNPTRLDAESIRDAILKTAGQLNPSIGGPGYYDFTTFTRNTQFYTMRDPVGWSFHRRSLYRTWVRSGRNQFLDVFDCPDPSTKTPKRAVTITPLQALSLLNNSFLLRMSSQFAQRIQREAGPNTAEQVKRAWQLAYGREPDQQELQQGISLVEKHGLFSLCRVLYNSNEFLYVD